MNSLELSEYLRRGPHLLDGGMGTLFIAMGLQQGLAPEAWNLDHPDRVASAHQRYVDAGSNIIQTNTFGASPAKLASCGLQGRCDEINAIAVDLARKAAGSRALVAGDVGPTGRFLSPMGDATEQELQDNFGRQIAALVRAGVDLISVETMYDVREALAAVRAAAAAGMGVMCSMTFESRARGVFTIMGDKLGPSLKALHEAGAAAVGFNCTVTSDAMKAMVVQACEALPGVPIVAQPNAGQPKTTAAGIVYDASPEVFAADLLEMTRAGAAVVGGCCGTHDGFIQAARRALDGAAPNGNA
jgi:5-methyltetrahydrofolate--homocysteine methyltransferase